MRIKDIQVGEKYAVGYGVGVEVLEKGLERATYTGKTRRDGVLCRVFSSHRAGAEVVYASQEVKELWKDYEERKAARKLAEELRERNYSACKSKAEGYEAQLKEAGIELKRIYNSVWNSDNSNDFLISIEISSRNLEKIVAALAEPDAKQRIQQATKDQAEQSSSALDALFG